MPFAPVSNVVLPSTPRTAAKPRLSDLATELLAAIAVTAVGDGFVVPGVYDAADKATLRPATAHKPAATEAAIKIRALGTVAGRMAARGGHRVKVIDNLDGSVTVAKLNLRTKRATKEAEEG